MIENIIKGIQAYTGTLALISKLRLWKYFIIPMGISLVTASLVFLAAYGWSDNLGRFIASAWPWETGLEVVTTISTYVASVVILVLGLISYKHIIMGLSAPFMGPVSEKIETYLTGVPSKNFYKASYAEQLIRGLRVNLRNLFQELLYTVPILLLKFIPVVNIFSAGLLFLMQSYYAGFGNMDYTLERHFKYKGSLQFVRKHRGYAIGNGIVFLLMLFVPVIGIILVLPFSVTAASLQTVKLLMEEGFIEAQEEKELTGFEPLSTLKS